MDPRPERGGRNLKWSSVGCILFLDDDVDQVERDVGVKLDECGAFAVGEEHECVVARMVVEMAAGTVPRAGMIHQVLAWWDNDSGIFEADARESATSPHL